MWLKIILKVTKKQVFILSLKDAFLEKSQGEFSLSSVKFCTFHIHILKGADV